MVYFQAAMLAIVAPTFFIFGLMVGTRNSPDQNYDSNTEFQLTGTINFTDRNRMIPDAGAVIVLLPQKPYRISRQDPSSIHPDQFEPLENSTIDWVRKQGGEVLRANVDGFFEIYAKRNRYFLIVVSKRTNQKENGSTLSKQQISALAQYFLPVEKLVEDKKFAWREVEISQDDVEIAPIQFD
ncbi:MAG: hypothetical protein AAGA30_20035 [Planctomycetota bacterium]